jgi:hypothetical protein
MAGQHYKQAAAAVQYKAAYVRTYTCIEKNLFKRIISRQPPFFKANLVFALLIFYSLYSLLGLSYV